MPKCLNKYNLKCFIFSTYNIIIIKDLRQKNYKFRWLQLSFSRLDLGLTYLQPNCEIKRAYPPSLTDTKRIGDFTVFMATGLVLLMSPSHTYSSLTNSRGLFGLLPSWSLPMAPVAQWTTAARGCACQVWRQINHNTLARYCSEYILSPVGLISSGTAPV